MSERGGGEASDSTFEELVDKRVLSERARPCPAFRVQADLARARDDARQMALFLAELAAWWQLSANRLYGVRDAGAQTAVSTDAQGVRALEAKTLFVAYSVSLY